MNTNTPSVVAATAAASPAAMPAAAAHDDAVLCAGRHACGEAEARICFATCGTELDRQRDETLAALARRRVLADVSQGSPSATRSAT